MFYLPSSPERAASNELFPQPTFPTTTTKEPCSTQRSHSSSDITICWQNKKLLYLMTFRRQLQLHNEEYEYIYEKQVKIH